MEKFQTWDEAPITHIEAHARPENLDPKVNGPFLDDLRDEQEAAYRTARMSRMSREYEAARAAAETVTDDAGQTRAETLGEFEDKRDELNIGMAALADKKVDKNESFRQQAMEQLSDKVTLGDHTPVATQLKTTKDARKWAEAKDGDALPLTNQNEKGEATESSTLPRKKPGAKRAVVAKKASGTVAKKTAALKKTETEKRKA